MTKERNILEISVMGKKMDMELIFIATRKSMKAIGKTIKGKGKESSSLKTGTSTLGNEKIA